MSAEDKPPSPETNVGARTGVLPAPGTLAGRFKGFWADWSSSWGVCVAGTNLHGRCYSISMDIQTVKYGADRGI